jgi:predicted alpha/beta hydrolase
MGTSASFYQPFADALTTNGFSVISPELPGTGASRPQPSRNINYGYRDLVETYLPEIVNSAQQAARGAPVILIGHSLGSQIGTLAVATATIKIDALVTIAGGSIHYRNWDGAGSAKVLFASLLFSSLTRLFGYLPGQYVGFGGPQARTLIQEWSKIIRTGRFSHIADVSNYSGGTPMLAIGIEGDTFAPERSVSTLAGILDGEVEMMPKTWKGSPHSSWARNPVEIVNRIVDWVGSIRRIKAISREFKGYGVT